MLATMNQWFKHKTKENMDVEGESAASCQGGIHRLSCWRQKAKQREKPADNQQFYILTFAKSSGSFLNI